MSPAERGAATASVTASGVPVAQIAAGAPPIPKSYAAVASQPPAGGGARATVSASEKAAMIAAYKTTRGYELGIDVRRIVQYYGRNVGSFSVMLWMLTRRKCACPADLMAIVDPPVTLVWSHVQRGLEVAFAPERKAKYSEFMDVRNYDAISMGILGEVRDFDRNLRRDHQQSTLKSCGPAEWDPTGQRGVWRNCGPTLSKPDPFEDAADSPSADPSGVAGGAQGSVGTSSTAPVPGPAGDVPEPSMLA